MSRKILTAVLLLFAAALVAASQTNTLTAGHKILVGTTTAASACGTVPNVSNVSAVFQ